MYDFPNLMSNESFKQKVILKIFQLVRMISGPETDFQLSINVNIKHQRETLFASLDLEK